jgi:hypothetical protein
VIYASIISIFLSSHFLLSTASVFFTFLALMSIIIQTTTTTKQQIQTTGLTANREIQIAKNPKTNVKAKARIPVHTPISLDKKGNTFAKVVMNSSIIENHQNISNNSTNLKNHVHFLFASCA